MESSTTAGTVGHFTPDILSSTDYYAFGSLMPGRSFNPGEYPFGMNGQRGTDEIAGVGNHYTAEFWEYDPRTGRRWNLDPKPNISISPYAAFANNPICLSDVKGDTTYRFNAKGIFQGMANLDQGGIWGSIGANKTVKGADGNKINTWESQRDFKFNDNAEDKKQLNSLEEGQKGITFVTDGNLDWVMNKSSIQHRSFFDRWNFASAESSGGRMDFNLRYTLPSQYLISESEVKQFDGLGGFMLMGNNVAYNLNDTGQFIWGQAMNRLGFDYSSAKIGSESFARTFEFGWDTNADQSAIRAGFFYKPAIKKPVAGPFEGMPMDGFRRDARR